TAGESPEPRLVANVGQPPEPPAVTQGSARHSPRPNDPGDESSDDDSPGGGVPRWREVPEDRSTPDELEVREIENSGEHSALDHDYWEERSYTPLDDPEYVPGASGRFEWKIDHYNGTKENPNKELVMKSQIASIGGYDWQIKFYPRGNESDYLSVYVDCVSITKPKPQEDESKEPPNGKAKEPKGEKSSPTSETKNEAIEYQTTPLPPLSDKPIPKRKSLAAQVSVVLYNPSEPRTNIFRSCQHRFCPDSPDWGWTRFHGPHYDLHYRHRGQRRPLLQNDTLAFTCYVRIVKDKTDCLWEHQTPDNPWDSFAMTGLQGLSTSESNLRLGGNLISAISSWMLLKPFRKFLYELELPHPEHDARARPKPLLAALQIVLFKLRTDIEPRSSAVELEDVIEALEWYGIEEQPLNKLDVIEIWEIMRSRIEYELADTPSNGKFTELFGPERDRTTNVPTYRVPVRGYDTIRDAVAGATNLVHPGCALPQILHIELERQEFNEDTRQLKKTAKKIQISESIKVQDVNFMLYGFIAHKESLQSGLYYSVLRPGGVGGKWYAYHDNRDENKVVCLTRKQALGKHEGGSSERAPVAYIAMYVRADVCKFAFRGEEPVWKVPSWVVEEVDRNSPSPSPSCNGKAGEVSDGSSSKGEKEMVDYQVIDSRAFLSHEGPGVIDMYDSKWNQSPYFQDLPLSKHSRAKDIRAALMSRFTEVKDSRQIRFWFLDQATGSALRPNMPGSAVIESQSDDPETGGHTIANAVNHYPEHRLWVHIIDAADLPPLPKKKEAKEQPRSSPEQQSSAQTERNNGTGAPNLPSNPPDNDTPMSDSDVSGETAGEAPVHASGGMNPALTLPLDGERADIEAFIDAGQAFRRAGQDFRIVLPSEGEAVVPPPPATEDVEMGNNRPPPPPPGPPFFDTTVVFGRQGNNPPPPPPTNPACPPLSEVYFFLKIFDANTQTIRAHSTNIAHKTDRVGATVLKALSLPPDTPLDIHEEEFLTSTRSITRSDSFHAADLHSTCILIATTPPIPESTRSQLADRAAFSSPDALLAALTAARSLPPHRHAAGFFTLDHFSSEPYTGLLSSGQAHGHGTRTHSNGDVYAGTYRLGLRHGHGKLIHANGDEFAGSFADNVPEGQGSYTSKETGNVYVGGWRAGKRFGEGVTWWRRAEEGEQLCKICYEEGVEAAFWDCGHVIACLACARRVDVCPVCR
ncbi:hypothetical protein K490DRAFT_10525, partial [Saccharata proteae CBS 121410]